MNASVLDLRYKMNQVLEALDHQETVNVLYHGKIKGVIHPVGKVAIRVQDHEFFASAASEESIESVPEVMARIRGGRYHDL